MTDHNSLTARMAFATGAAILALSLAACQGGGGPAGGGSTDGSAEPTASATPAAAPTTAASDDSETDGADDAPENPDESEADSGDGENFVVVGDVRYEAQSVVCSGNDGGMEIIGEATGPTPSEIAIGGVFGVGDAEDPPDMVFVMFDAGQSGQWSAMTEVQGFSLGSLSNLSYTTGAGATGDATFDFHLEGSVSSEGRESGHFQFEC